MASTAKPEVTEIAHNLAELAARQDLPESQRWMQAVVLAQTLADCLRTRNESSLSVPFLSIIHTKLAPSI